MGFEKVSDCVWEMKKQGAMRVPARVFATEKLFGQIEQGAMEQLVNTAQLPGIQKVALGMPDMHWGYGFPIGGVAAFDAKENGIVSPGGIGFDINCTHPDSKILLDNGAWLKIKDMENCFGESKLPILDLQTNSKINATPVLFLKREENQGIIEIKTNTGRTLKVTGDHSVLSKSGMKKAVELKKECIAVYGFTGVRFEKPSSEIIVSEKDIGFVLDKLGVVDSGNAKKQIMEFFEKINILPLRYDSPQLPALLKLLGFIFGDGAISVTKRLWQVSFYAKKEDLGMIRQDILSLGFKAQNIFSRKRKHAIHTFYGKNEFEFVETSLAKKSKAFVALLLALGAPFGAKAHKPYRVPKWILNAPIWQKRLFLAAFFGAELSSPKTLNKYNFYEPALGMNKKDCLKENAMDFLNDIRLMLLEFGIRSSFPVEVNGYKYSGQKGPTIGLRIKVAGNSKNLIRLFETIGFEYNKEKQKKGCLAAGYLRLKNSVSKERENARAEAIGRYATGETISEIKKTLVKEFVPAQFIQHSVWTKFKNPPRVSFEFISFEEYCKKSALGNEGFLWEEIREIRITPYKGLVYDLTIADKNHNFVADSFVVSNCGIRLIRTSLVAKDIKPRLPELMDILFRLVPAGVGGKGKIRLGRKELAEMFGLGAKYMVEKGFGWKKDLERIEEKGSMKGADPEKVSDKAFERGMPQAGTLGSGNHFLEVQAVDRIFDDAAAKAFGLFEGQAVVMLHSGSRGAGHQIATDYISVMLRAMEKYGIKVNDRQLACAPIESREGRDYLGAMWCGVNYAFANRQAMTHWVRQGFEQVFGQDAEKLGMDVVYDICHNVAKLEKHEVDGKKKELLVHRKGATRAMPAGRKENPKAYAKTGHPAIIPGSMGTASYVLVGTEKGFRESFASVCHGAGRTMSRHEAMRRKRGSEVKRELEARGEVIRGKSEAGLAEEMPEAYKDIDEVIESIVLSGIGKKVSRHLPLAVMKG